MQLRLTVFITVWAHPLDSILLPRLDRYDVHVQDPLLTRGALVLPEHKAVFILGYVRVVHSFVSRRKRVARKAIEKYVPVSLN